MPDPSTATSTPICGEIGATATANSATSCPHCGSTARHSDRIGCCSGCKRLFTSLSAFDRHRRHMTCLTPEEAGLEEKVVKGDPSVPGYGWPAGVMSWGQK